MIILMLFHFTFDFFPSSHLSAFFPFSITLTFISIFLPLCFLLYVWVGVFFPAFLFCHSGQFQWCQNAFCCLLLQWSCYFDFHTTCFPLQIRACWNSRGQKRQQRAENPPPVGVCSHWRYPGLHVLEQTLGLISARIFGWLKKYYYRNRKIHMEHKFKSFICLCWLHQWNYIFINSI